MCRPSFIAHRLSGILMWIGAIACIVWLYNNSMEFRPVVLQAVIILFMLSMALIVGIHGISHALQERNPIRNLPKTSHTYII